MNTFTIPRVLLFGGIASAAVVLSAAAVSAEEGPAITTTIHTSAHATTTAAAIGTLVHAEARAATSTGTSPTGTFDFSLYSNTSCSGTPVVQSGVAILNGIAESEATSVPASGLSYRVRYSGDGANAPSEGACTTLIATGPHVSITTELSSTTVRVGTSVTDSATLHSATANASGTVMYRIYTNNACTANMQSAGTKQVVNGTVPDSDPVTFNTPGTHFWQAVYSGDSLNAAATSTCTSGRLRVLATSTPPKGDEGEKGKHKGWIFGLPFGILKKVFHDIGLPPGIFEKFEDHLDDEDVVDLKLKLRAAAGASIGDDDGGNEGEDRRRGIKEWRDEMREKAKDMREALRKNIRENRDK